ncbi:hypothetical protein [Pantoea sp.]|uniref:hypothetical protein n=1 Tax=Pantoea sp. TaxID=69393 RepID=UPI0031E35D07
MNKYIVVSLAVLISACATKQYPQSANVTSEEALAFDCPALQQEIARQHSIQEEIKQTGEFDGRTVLGFLADFGVGNGLAKSSATQKAQNRLMQLESLRTVKCSPQAK